MKDLKYMLAPYSKTFYIAQDEIEKFRPTRAGRYDLHGAATIMVSERHDKYDLVDLVNALLHKIHEPVIDQSLYTFSCDCGWLHEEVRTGYKCQCGAIFKGKNTLFEGNQND